MNDFKLNATTLLPLEVQVLQASIGKLVEKFCVDNGVLVCISIDTKEDYRFPNTKKKEIISDVWTQIIR